MITTDVLRQDIKFLKGVGPARAKMLGEELGIFTIGDLLHTFPFKYIDRSKVYAISQLQDDMPYVQLRGRILDFNTEGEGRKRRLKATFTDGSGVVDLVWFAGIKYVEQNLKVNQTYILLGKPNPFMGRYSFAHPELEKYDADKGLPKTMQPFYHTSDKMKRSNLTSRAIGELVKNAFELITAPLEETLPPGLLHSQNLIDRTEALRTIHHPQDASQVPAASRRLKFEELFYLQLDILRYSKNQSLKYAGFHFPRVGQHFLDFYNNRLPFKLTEAQKRVIREIRGDLGSGKQMNRLLQGDVGSGKTMVALMCCLLAIDNGYQACLMAPTEILAEQHLTTLREFLGDMNIHVELLTGTVTGKRRKEVLDGIASGQVQILVGTHALIEPNVHFLNLGLAVIDEQHRFGVKQRAMLWEKNVNPPHVLVMTATPIPRTLAMTVYGDLEVSVIDELPPGRKPIKTLHYFTSRRDELYVGMRRELEAGRQVYVVFPLIEESEKSDMHNLEEGFEAMQSRFPQYKVGKVHGKMRPDEKESAMHDFIHRHTQILVSTTVIEVGVNVPNASVMVIEDADRFGLAQLHQLRGRVGRGADQSYCILMTKFQLSESTRRRMQIMVESTDGFEIAEEDMKLRGPGDLEGTQQSGLPFDLRIANVVKDVEIMAIAREAAKDTLEADPYEQLPQNEVIWRQLRMMKKQKVNFSAIS